MSQTPACLGCGVEAGEGRPVCDTCAADPFAMEDARGRAAARGDLATLPRLYGPPYAYLPEGKITSLWEDYFSADKDTIPDFTAWRNVRSVGLLPEGSRRIFEVGVGAGHAQRLLRQRFPGAELYGIDLSPRLVERVSDEIRGTFAVSTIENLPWPHVQFDAILMLEVLEHIEAPRTFGVLRKLRERLTERGVLVLSVPMREELRRSYFPCPHCGHPVHQIGHLRSYAPELLRAELAVAGLAVEKELPLAGGRYFGIRRQYLMPFFPKKVQPMVFIARCRASG